jgi:hypothetical protein
MAYAFGAPSIVQDGLIFYVDAANKDSYPGSGTSCTDISGNRAGTLSSSPTFSKNNAGEFNYDGTDYIGFSTISDFSGFTAISFCYWVKYTSPQDNSWENVFGNGYWHTGFWSGLARSGIGGADVVQPMWNIRIGGSNNWVGGEGADDASNNPSSPSIGLLEADRWYHIAGTWDGSTQKIFVDGGIQDYKSTSGTADSNSDAFGISKAGAVGYYIEGAIGPLWIYSRGLTDGEVLQNYNALKGRFI